jgi:Leucine-rich repeat (LRR) protein
VFSLTILNLNDNRIQNLQLLVHEDSTPFSAAEIFDIHPQMLPKYQGFPNLLSLHLCNNLISNLDNLIGIVFISGLESVYLEGNPVMKQLDFKKSKTANRKALSRGNMVSAPSFNIFKHFIEFYNIRISDQCYRLNLKITKVRQRCISMKSLCQLGHWRLVVEL